MYLLLNKYLLNLIKLNFILCRNIIFWLDVIYKGNLLDVLICFGMISDYEKFRYTLVFKKVRRERKVLVNNCNLMINMLLLIFRN